MNTIPPGEWAIAKLSLESGEITSITPGEKPTLSPDHKILAFLRNGQLWVRYMISGTEHVAYKPHFFEGGVRSPFWLADSNTLIFNIVTGSDAFGEGARCTELDLASGKVKVLWEGENACLAAVRPAFLRSEVDRN